MINVSKNPLSDFSFKYNIKVSQLKRVQLISILICYNLITYLTTKSFIKLFCVLQKMKVYELLISRIYATNLETTTDEKLYMFHEMLDKYLSTEDMLQVESMVYDQDMSMKLLKEKFENLKKIYNSEMRDKIRKEIVFAVSHLLQRYFEENFEKSRTFSKIFHHALENIINK